MTTNLQPHFTLKYAAAQLGVHVQTLRNWERSGLIELVRLPGSQYRRVPLAEIERLQASMGISNAGSTVRMVSPHRDMHSLAKAKELAEVVKAELVILGIENNLDQFMQESRGRGWSP